MDRNNSNNKFLIKRIAVKGQSVFSQTYNRRQSIRNRIPTTQLVGRQNRQLSTYSSDTGVNSKRLVTKILRCAYIGCGKVFFTLNSLNYHKNKHLIKNPFEDSNPLIGPKAVINTIVKTESVSNRQLVSDWIQSLPANRSDPVVTNPIMTSVPSLGYSSCKRVRMYYTTDVYLEQKRCICDFCGYKTYGFKSSTRMAIHINGSHLKRQIYVCDVEDCKKTFSAPNTLRTHKMNHLCGFGIENGKTLTTVCGNNSINRFRGNILIKGFKYFKCDFNTNCQFITNNTNAIKRHIHDKHLCPNRVNFQTNVRKTGINSIDLLENFDEYCEQFFKDGLQFFKCKRCVFFTQKFTGIIAHIKLKHFLNKASEKSFFFKANCSSFKCLQQKQGTSGYPNNCGYDYQNLEHNYQKKNITIKSEFADRKSSKDKEKWIKWMPFQCDVCERSFNDLHVMRKHIKTHIKF